MGQDKQDRIRNRAYEKWQKEGEAHGWHDRHWAEAEAEITAEERSAQKTVRSVKGKKASSAAREKDEGAKPARSKSQADAGAVKKSVAKSASRKSVAIKKASNGEDVPKTA